MEHSFTRNQLIRFIYNEINGAERQMIREHIDLIPELNAEYNALKNFVSALPKLEVEPSDLSVDKILRYSKRRTVEMSI